MITWKSILTPRQYVTLKADLLAIGVNIYDLPYPCVLKKHYNDWKQYPIIKLFDKWAKSENFTL